MGARGRGAAVLAYRRIDRGWIGDLRRIAPGICELSPNINLDFTPALVFPERNNLITGLCQAIVIVKAAAKSGTFITARQALEQGRAVLAVPGHPMDAHTTGCNVLIRDGACLVCIVDDILQAIHSATQQTTPQPLIVGQTRPQTIQATLPLPPGKTQAYQTQRRDLVQTLH